MNKDPVEWLGQHCGAGVDLREEGYALRTDDPVPAWERKAEVWTKELIEGVMSWSPGDMMDIEPLNRIPVEQVKPENPFYDPDAVDLGMTATGPGRPGNTSLNRLSGLVDRAYLIRDRWRESPPKQHDSPGRKRIIHTDGIKLARKLLQEKTATSNSEAALMAVKKLGHGPHASDDAAIQSIRRKISLL